MSDQVHYEVFIRRALGAAWKLDIATDDRGKAVKAAEELISEKGVVAVRVCKETFDQESGEFRSITILTKGDLTETKAKKAPERTDPLCVSPQDLYTPHARDRIARLLETWLAREGVTPFELLHRADLVERLEASGTELQHALQKISVPEAQERGVSTHEVMRTFQSLSERAIARIEKDAARKAFPNFEKESFADAATRLINEPERVYLLGGGVAEYIADARNWGDKVNRLLDLADAAPEGATPARALALAVIETPLSEILGSRAGMADVLGAAMDLGLSLAAMTRLAGAEQIDALLAVDPQLAGWIPALPGPAARLANWLDGPHFQPARVAIAKRVLRELHGPRRLTPGDADSEIELLRALAMALTAAAGRVLSPDDIKEAFVVRSRMLTASSFVTALLGEGKTVLQEAAVLIRLAENVAGAGNKRDAARYLDAHVAALRFEKELRQGPESPAAKLMALAGLQKAMIRARLPEADVRPVRERLGEVGGLIEADARLIASIVRAPAPATQRLAALVRLASGDTCPVGPATERAKAEAAKLARAPELREELVRSPEKAAEVRELITAMAA